MALLGRNDFLIIRKSLFHLFIVFSHRLLKANEHYTEHSHQRCNNVTKYEQCATSTCNSKPNYKFVPFWRES